MPLMLQVLLLFLIQPNLSFDLDVFDQNVDSILKEVIGHNNLDAERSRWTTSKRMRELKNRPVYMPGTAKRRHPTTTKKKTKTHQPTTTSKNNSARAPSIKEIKQMIKIREAEKILNDPRVGLPNLKEADDSTLVTKLFDELKDKKYNILRAASAREKIDRYQKDSRKYSGKMANRLAEIDGRRQDFSKKTIRKRNIMRNRTLTIMEHFIYATRYKLVYSQLLRKKYMPMLQYKIGFLFSLLRRLKAEQLILFSTLSHYRTLMFSLDYHVRTYEKIVRLDVDIKDILRLIQTLNRERQLLKDPNYLELYYEEESDKPPDYAEQNRRERQMGRTEGAFTGAAPEGTAAPAPAEAKVPDAATPAPANPAPPPGLILK